MYSKVYDLKKMDNLHVGWEVPMGMLLSVVSYLVSWEIPSDSFTMSISHLYKLLFFCYGHNPPKLLITNMCILQCHYI